jgi:EAL domain-containing protein (putative c-di-GMP-specific phosphodiesterase class I)
MSDDNVAELLPRVPPDPRLDRYGPHLRKQEGHVESLYRNFRIRSAYQPIYSFAHNRPVGFEGLARAWNECGDAVAPGMLLSADRSSEGIVFLDRLLRALHLANFSGAPFDNSWLFLNVSPEVVIHGRSYGPFFREALKAAGMAPQRVVVEITEGESQDENALEDATRYYRDLGCLVAIDDFGAGHSNFNRIWRLHPDIVKLDRVMIARATRDQAARRGLIGVAGLLHEMGALVLAEGVETEEEAIISLHAEVDLLQGYLFGRPFVGTAPPLIDAVRFDALRGALGRMTRSEETEFQTLLRPYLDAFDRAAGFLAGGLPLGAAVADLLGTRQVMRCYLLDSQGAQKSENLTSPVYSRRHDLRHDPLGSAIGANWMHRHYFRRAMSSPGRSQISRPYLSLTDPQMCITLSRAVPQESEMIVLCCDLEYPLGRAS